MIAIADVPEAPSTPRLPLRATMSDKDWRARQNRWKRRYKTLADWVAGHPGQAAGRLVGTVPDVVYFRNSEGHLCWAPFDKDNIPPAILSQAEYRIELGLDTAPASGNVNSGHGDPGGIAVDYRIPAGPMPTWPPTPEDWTPKRKPSARKVKTRDDVLADIATLAEKWSLTPRELGNMIPARGILLGTA